MPERYYLDLEHLIYIQPKPRNINFIRTPSQLCLLEPIKTLAFNGLRPPKVILRVLLLKNVSEKFRKIAGKNLQWSPFLVYLQVYNQ